jgi:hypothetical protein
MSVRQMTADGVDTASEKSRRNDNAVRHHLDKRWWGFCLAQSRRTASMARTRRTGGSDLSAPARHKSVPGAGRSPSSSRSPSSFTKSNSSRHAEMGTTHRHPFDDTSSSRPRVHVLVSHAPRLAWASRPSSYSVSRFTENPKVARRVGSASALKTWSSLALTRLPYYVTKWSHVKRPANASGPTRCNPPADLAGPRICQDLTRAQ